MEAKDTDSTVAMKLRLSELTIEYSETTKEEYDKRLLLKKKMRELAISIKANTKEESNGKEKI